MRIACLQFSPHLGDVQNNLNRADSVLSKANTEDLDLLVLPELAFSDHHFKLHNDIAGVCEPSQSGITSLWARSTALKHNCHVAVGYPENVAASPQPKCFNSTILVNRDGETVANYRKVFLHDGDKGWAQEGEGFYSVEVPEIGNVCLGICTDIDPRDKDTPRHAFEFAYHILDTGSTLVIVTMSCVTLEEPRSFSRMPNEPDMESLMHWVTRLEPLIRIESTQEVFIVFCNRCGSEADKTYAGTSAVLGIVEGEVKVYGLLGRGERELLLVDTEKPPFGKLVYRPNYEEEQERTTEASGPLLHHAEDYTTGASSQSELTLLSQQSIDGVIGPEERTTRPKLIIPAADAQGSFGSARSGTSTKSVARPPEDSTPYPHSAGTRSLERYLAENRIYGGDQVVISHLDTSPTTSSQPATASASFGPWRPPDTLMWTSDVLSPSANTAGAEGRTQSENDGAGPQSQIAPALKRVGCGTAGSGCQQDIPRRPSSPKSRNASRVRDENRQLQLLCDPTAAEGGRDFERVEAVLSPTCPIHGQRNSNNATDEQFQTADTEVQSRLPGEGTN